jgi:hypothetical protein
MSPRLNLRAKLRPGASLVLLTIWMVAATLIYFRQFAQPALNYFSRVVAHR